MPGPPALVSPVHHQVEQDPHRQPRNTVDGFSHRHPQCPRQDNGDVDAPDPPLLRVLTRKVPDGDRRHQPEQEEVVHLLVQPQLPEHAKGPYNAPDYGGVVEHVVPRAGPWAARGQICWVTNVFNGGQEPPSCAEAHQGSDHRPHELNQEHRFWRDFHVMAELEVGEERDGLRHAYGAVGLEHDVG